MPHLYPIPEHTASDQVKKTYTDIKEVFSIEIVPLLFQYLANFEEYFVYTFERIKKNVSHENFLQSHKEMIHFAQEAVHRIYIPSQEMQQLTQKISDSEKIELLHTIDDLQEINAKLLLLSIGLRENIKGVFVGLTKLDGAIPFSNIQIDIDYSNKPQIYQEKNNELVEHTTMLAPLFGSHALQISHMPVFFEQSALEMENLVKTENYLEQRVSLEHVTLKGVANLPYPLGGSYQEIMKLAGRKPYFKELFYLLVETFPSALPKLLLTTAVMQKALQKQTAITKR